MSRTALYTQAISNRIGASSPRARFLGMAVGVAISKLVDGAALRLAFDFEDDEAEAVWYQHLTCVEDKMGSIRELRISETMPAAARQSRSGPVKQPSSERTRKPSKQKMPQEAIGPRIVEVVDESEDDDLVPYATPDSDPEDDADDPSLIDRNKPKAPV